MPDNTKSQLLVTGQVAIVTGAGQGLGRAHALLLASRGAKLVVTSRPTSIQKAESVCEEIRQAGGEALAVGGHVGNDDDAKELIRRTIEKFGRVDIIVHNAGTLGDLTSVESDPGPGFDAEIEVNLKGTLQINRAAWPYMEKQKYGRILFTSSATAFGWYTTKYGNPASYVTAKAGQFGTVRQVAAAGELHNIKANAILPRAYTPMVDANMGTTARGQWMKKYFPEEQCAIVSLFLLHKSCPVTGQFISTGGGLVTRVFYASTQGYFNSEITPEDVRDNWAAVEGGSMKEAENLQDCFEVANLPAETAFYYTKFPPQPQ